MTLLSPTSEIDIDDDLADTILNEMAKYVFTSKYARYLPDLKRRETWEEATERVEAMHLRKYDFLPGEDKAEIRRAFDFVRDMRVVPSMRSMQFGGAAMEKINLRGFNCFDENNEFITSTGVESFSSHADGDVVEVLGHSGNWRKAEVRSFGEQDFHTVTFRKGKNSFQTQVTRDHRWILLDGSETTNLQVGDYIVGAPSIYDFDFDDAEWDEKLYWCYGYVYGDGTRVKRGDGSYKGSMVRLCGHDKNYADRFESLGFSTSTPLSCNGDFMAYTGSYLKTAPDPEVDDQRLVRAFVAGYLAADGEKNGNYGAGSGKSLTTSPYLTITSADEDHMDFIRNCFPAVGMYITSETDLTGEETNYGVRGHTVRFRLCSDFGSRKHPSSVFRVEGISDAPTSKGEAWCLVVDEDESFVMPNGLVTGNCAVRHIDSVRSFAEVFYLLLCGAGVGLGLSKKYLGRLPDLVGPEDKTGTILTYVIEDNIEGWADSIEALLSCYFVQGAFSGRKIVFDYSRIRKEGSPLKTGGGRAPGYKGLKNAHQKIKALLDRIIEEEGVGRLRTIDAYDILMHTADAVLSGGVRRSATSVMFDPDDELMMNAKVGEWWAENPQRARSNNSVRLNRNTLSLADIQVAIERTKEWGEPGFVFVENEDVLLNPSLRGDTRVLTEAGIFPIKDLEGRDFRVKNLYGEWAEASCRQSGTGRKLMKVNLLGGHSYYATPEHKWPVVEKSGFRKTQTMDLKPGDHLPVVMSETLFDSDFGDEDDGFLIGWLYGDGWITDRKDNGKRQYGLIVSKSDNESGILKKLKAIMERKFGPVNFTEREGGHFETSIQRKSADDYFKSFGVDKKELGLPASTWTASDAFRKGLVDGLLSSDGSVNTSSDTGRRTLAFSSSRKRLADDFVELLSFYGVQTTKHSYTYASGRTFPNGKTYNRDYTTHQVFISRGLSLEHFADVFVISHEEKMKKYVERVDLGDGFISPNSTTIKVVSIEDTSIYEDVWDISVWDKTHCFQLSHCVTGNCFEINFIPVTDDGICGVQVCNLTSITGGKMHTARDLEEAAWAASVIGTLQAGYTDFKYLGHAAEQLTREESLLGVSMTGMMESPDICLNPDIQRHAMAIAVETNRVWAAKIGIPQAARVGAIKPEGNSSLARGTIFSGIHPGHAEKTMRTIQANRKDPVHGLFKMMNPSHVEPSVHSANDTDDVVLFPLRLKSDAIFRKDITALEHLAIVKSTQENWVMPGTTVVNRKPLAHNVSCTISVGEHEWNAVAEYIYEHREMFTAVSMLPEDGDEKYIQPPLQEMKTQEQLEKWRRLAMDFIPIDYTLLVEDEDGTSLQQELSCAGNQCVV